MDERNENQKPKDYNDSTSKILILSKSLLLLSLSVILLSTSFLLLINPDINYYKKQQIEIVEKQIMEATVLKDQERRKEMMNWVYDLGSDVDIKNSKYPIVVLRTGYKILKFESNSALVGWTYEAMNTSPKTRYSVNVTYEFTDSDGFTIASDEGSASIDPNEYGIIRGITTIPLSDIDRLSDRSWRIGLTPNWTSSEGETKGDRYERLKDIIVDNGPYWIIEEMESSNFPFGLSEKWTAINDAIVKKMDRAVSKK